MKDFHTKLYAGLLMFGLGISLCTGYQISHHHYFIVWVISYSVLVGGAGLVSWAFKNAFNAVLDSRK